MDEILRKLPLSLQAIAVTALAYAAAYAFQFGFLHHYGVSFRAIDINFTTLIVGLAGTLYVIFIADQFMTAYRIFYRRLSSETPEQRFKLRLARTFLVLITLNVGLYAIGTSMIVFLIMNATVVIQVFSEPLASVLRFRSLHIGLKEMYKRIDEEREKKSEIVEPYFVQYMGHTLVVLLVIVSSLLGGKLYAQVQRNMYVIGDKDGIKTVLIQKNGDTLVTKKYDVISQKLEDGFGMERMPDNLYLKERVRISQ